MSNAEVPLQRTSHTWAPHRSIIGEGQAVLVEVMWCSRRRHPRSEGTTRPNRGVGRAQLAELGHHVDQWELAPDLQFGLSLDL
eukprot:5410395-Lingulodinium_polyedra.AAC.1